MVFFRQMFGVAFRRMEGLNYTEVEAFPKTVQVVMEKGLESSRGQQGFESVPKSILVLDSGHWEQQELAVAGKALSHFHLILFVQNAIVGIYLGEKEKTTQVYF